MTRTFTRPRPLWRTALALLALTAGGLLGAAPAFAQSAGPHYLTAGELPPHPSSRWYAGPVTAGRPDPLPLCGGETLPSTASHRTFRTDVDARALQVVVVERDERRAADYAELLRRSLARCAEHAAEDPDVTATRKSYGRLDVEEGAHVYGLHTVTRGGASDVSLWAVGRDGRAVTLVRWAQLGGFDSAPVKAFRRTTVTAVDKLY
ncbi:hypothetical protein [Streptomyces sp. SID11385]|uniref:hypothetical protein n=1 Tax=Streptomyces sp. SID11385 TaxID=2706031 RepID=UPI0013CB7545|nr:hypothetical protein [Streptomyces sp. SID11385]NEA43692.1 hypothetical protein [Streptomyces sp. SID11385]